MNNLSKRKILIIWIAVISLFIFYGIGYFFINGGNTNLDYRDHHIPLNDGWSVTLNGVTTDDAPLPFYVSTNQNEAVVFTGRLPSDIKENSGIIMRNYHQFLRVKVDGKQVFSFPNEEEWTGAANVISDEWCLVNLGPEDSGKTIELSFTNTTIYRFTAYVGDFYYGSDNSLVQYVRKTGFPGVVMGIIVTIIAGLLLIVSYIYRNHTNQSQNTAMGVALMGFGIWLINRAKMVIFPTHSNYVYLGSLLCLMFVAPFIFLYSYYRNDKFKIISLWGFRLCLLADLFLAITSLFIKYDVEVICMFAYGLSIVALTLNTYSLFLGGWGKPSKKKNYIHRLLDRTEFFSNLIIPVFGFLVP